jgi:hypothetical protein
MITFVSIGIMGADRPRTVPTRASSFRQHIFEVPRNPRVHGLERDRQRGAALPDEIGLALAGYLGTLVDRLDPVGSRLLDAGETRIRELRAIETRAQLMRRAAAKIIGLDAVMASAQGGRQVGSTRMALPLGCELGNERLLSGILDRPRTCVSDLRYRLRRLVADGRQAARHDEPRPPEAAPAMDNHRPFGPKTVEDLRDESHGVAERRWNAAVLNRKTEELQSVLLRCSRKVRDPQVRVFVLFEQGYQDARAELGGKSLEIRIEVTLPNPGDSRGFLSRCKRHPDRDRPEPGVGGKETDLDGIRLRCANRHDNCRPRSWKSAHRRSPARVQHTSE